MGKFGKSKLTPEQVMDAANQDLADNLVLFEDSVKTIADLIAEDVVAVDDVEIELGFLREQYKVVLILIENLIPLLRTAKLKYEITIQLQRKKDLMKNMVFIEKYCREQIFKSTGEGKPSAVDSHRIMTLPKRELPKFDGDIRNWLSFWAAYREIHEDKGISSSEKFHYLLQSMLHDSPAYKVVNSYPATEANYKAAVQSLQERFGRKKTLIKVYVRDLLKLVVNNSKQDKPTDFIELVTSLDSQIRNLEQLGVTADRFGELLYPVVESCIPEAVLDSYFRTPAKTEELQDLMKYLREEVHRKMQTSLAQSQFQDEDKSGGSTNGNKNKNRSSNSSSCANMV